MKIGYYINWNEASHGVVYRGVFRKVSDQVSLWNKMGHEVRLYILTGTECALAQYSHPVVDSDIETYPSRLIRPLASKRLLARLSTWRPSIVYCRLSTFTPAFGTLVRRQPVVMEINSDDLADMSLGPQWRYWYHRLTRDAMLGHLAGFVFVTSELAERRHFATYESPSVTIGNGIDLTGYPASPPPSNCQPRLVFIGSPGIIWHGTDKFMDLALRFQDWHFDVIGLSERDVRVITPPNVTLHGFLDRSGYEAIMLSADVAIGSLALHRAHLSEASPLKVREYLAYGIPTIIGYRDTDFAKGAPFLLELPNTPSNVSESGDRIREFVDHWRGRRVSRDQISHLDVRHKEAHRLAFLEACLTGSSPP